MVATTHLVTGLLGTGKTTLIRQLILQRPAGARWAVLVNEFGQVGIDQALLPADDGVAVRELAGGCLCCTLGAPLRVTLTRLLREVRPDRLFIEPTGLGHPARVLDTLRSPGFTGAVRLGRSICLVDPRRLRDERVLANPVFRDQVQLADVLAAAKSDLATEDDRALFQAWASRQFPPKSAVVDVSKGHLPLSVVAEDAESAARSPRFPDLHRDLAQAAAADQGAGEEQPRTARPGRPSRAVGEGMGRQSCGWIFHADDRFQWSALRDQLMGLPELDRIKGVFHTDRGWRSIQRTGDALESTPSGWRRDSRLEIIGESGVLPDPVVLEEALLRCLVKTS